MPAQAESSGPGASSPEVTRGRHGDSQPLRILFLSFSWPHGKTFGGQLRALHTARALKALGQVDFAVFSVDSATPEAEARTREDFHFLGHFPPIPQPNRTPIQKLRWAFDVRHLNVNGCAVPPEARARILDAMPTYDLVWILNTRVANMLQLFRWPHTHLDIDDVPSIVLQSVAQSAPSFSARLKARLQQHLLQRRERLLPARFNTLSVCSEADRAYLGAGNSIHVIPNGFERPASPPVRRLDPQQPKIGFIGLYSYGPNLEGVRWFLEKCWPSIQKAVPGIRFRLAGKGTDGPEKPNDANVDALGWINDPADEIATWSAMIIPIQTGGGTRIKIADAFSRKCPVVSTRYGAYGYDVKHDRDLLLAGSPEEFADACVRLVQEPQHGELLAEAAWERFLALWTWDAIAPRIWSAAEDNLRKSTAPPGHRVLN